jgi:hypothetical protein
VSTHTSPYGNLTQEGPAVALAALCGGYELHDKSLVLHWPVALPMLGHHAPAAAHHVAPPPEWRILVVVVSTGSTRHTMKLITSFPSGLFHESLPETMQFVDTIRTCYQAFTLPKALEREGVHWFNVVIDDVVSARVPLWVYALGPKDASKH